MLVNNAGIQRPIDLRKGMEDIQKNEDEIEINLRSQIYLTARFIPLLSRRKDSAYPQCLIRARVRHAGRVSDLLRDKGGNTLI